VGFWYKSKDRAAVAGHRSGFEDELAEWLDARGIPYKYESLKIKYEQPAKVRTYTPDFVLGEENHKRIIIETKGRFLTSDRQKHLLVKEQHPDLDIRFVFWNPQQTISKRSKTTYAMWCEKYGFKWAKRVIPEEWLEELVLPEKKKGKSNDSKGNGA